MFSRIFFCFFFVITGWLFIFFKLQERVSVFMPGVEIARQYYVLFDYFFSIMVITKIIYMVFKIYFE